jgi:hypothetical protein
MRKQNDLCFAVREEIKKRFSVAAIEFEMTLEYKRGVREQNLVNKEACAADEKTKIGVCRQNYVNKGACATH